MTLALAYPDANVPAISNTLSGSATTGNAQNSLSNIIDYTIALQKVNAREALSRVRSWGDDWDGAGSLAPSGKAQLKAQVFIEDAFRLTNETNYAWKFPNISANESGAYVLEWWRGTKKLTIYVDSNGFEFVKVWGVNIFDEMDDGVIESDEGFKELWAWLST